MNLQEFVQKYSGRRVADDGSDKGKDRYYSVKRKDGSTLWCGYHQCGSLVKVYIREVLGQTAYSYGGDGGVANGWKNNAVFPFSHYEHIPFWSAAQSGDIVIFARHPSNWGYGHIGIIIQANEGHYAILEQNAGSGLGYGEGGDAITARKKSYKSAVPILGFVRPKTQNNPLSRKNIAEKIFQELSGNNQKNGKNARDIWNGQNANSMATRYEVVAMLKNYFSRVMEKNMDESRIWNGERPNDSVSEYELGVMIRRARSVL